MGGNRSCTCTIVPQRSAVPPPAGILHVSSQRTSVMHIFLQSGAIGKFSKSSTGNSNLAIFRNVLCARRSLAFSARGNTWTHD